MIIERLIRGGYNFVRILLLRIRLHDNIRISLIQPMRIQSQLMIKKGAKKVNIGHNFRLETNAKVRVIDGGELIIGNSCFINCNSYITVLGKTIIGDNCVIGPGVMIFDHDHDYRVEDGVKAGAIKTGEIVIGNNVWIGANCIILKGSIINDNAVIAAGSIVNGEVPNGCLLVQKRKTEIIQY